MRTPNKYLEYYKNNIPDEQMLADVIFAFNKFAKNARDKYKYDDKDLYYKKKQALLRYYFNDKIICIHKQNIGTKRKRIYDYEKEYDKIENPIWENCYWDYCENREVWFKDIIIDGELYFIYLEVGDKSFHQPISHIYKKI